MIDDPLDALKAELLALFDDYCADRTGRGPNAVLDAEVRRKMARLVDELGSTAEKEADGGVSGMITWVGETADDLATSLDELGGHLNPEELSPDAEATIVALREGIAQLSTTAEEWRADQSTEEGAERA